MKGLQVGHYTQEQYGTGATVFLLDEPAVGAYHLCGSSPAAFELTLLDLEADVTHIDALAFLGGSALGLPSVSGVQRWLQDRNRGWEVPHGRIPLVPAVAIYDLAYKDSVPPSDAMVYEACMAACEDNFQTGSIGAGTGATVGKIMSSALRMSGGVGYSEIHLSNDVSIIAYAVVNCVGDVRNNEGHIIAGARLSSEELKFLNCEKYLLQGQTEKRISAANTTLIALFTNAKFSKAELKRIAKMATAGMARVISPVFTRYDGDIVFCVSVGEKNANELTLGACAAEATKQAILNAVSGSIVLV
ncbi:MAG: P1 family peptidase [Gammaproteobacteria bacterium]|nr:P1 family peptidase [Gammaproteobacteria bacterium]